MTLLCINVNYFTRAKSLASGQTEQVPAATVSFQTVDGIGVIENFSLTYTDLTEPVDYFPGKQYELTLTPVVAD